MRRRGQQGLVLALHGCGGTPELAQEAAVEQDARDPPAGIAPHTLHFSVLEARRAVELPTGGPAAGQGAGQGAGFLAIQIVFDAGSYFHFVERAEAVGVPIPIVSRVTPIINGAKVQRFTRMCGATIPPTLLRRLEGV